MIALLVALLGWSLGQVVGRAIDHSVARIDARLLADDARGSLDQRSLCDVESDRVGLLRLVAHGGAPGATLRDALLGSHGSSVPNFRVTSTVCAKSRRKRITDIDIIGLRYYGYATMIVLAWLGHVANDQAHGAAALTSSNNLNDQRINVAADPVGLIVCAGCGALADYDDEESGSCRRCGSAETEVRDVG